MSFFRIALITLLILILLLGCREDNTVQPEESTYVYNIPENLNDGWTTGSLQEVGMNTATITEMIEFFNDFPNSGIHGLLIIKNNKLVLEEYFRGYKYVAENVPSESDIIEFGPDTLHYLADVSKIIIPLLFGIAREDGFVFDLDDYVKDYFQEYSVLFNNGKENIRLQDMMSMTSGIEWEENLFEYGYEQNDIQLLLRSDDPFKFFLEKDLTSIPGSNFNYNSGTTLILSEILNRITGTEIDQYADLKLFQPLEINKVKWDLTNHNNANTSAGLYLTLRDLAKLGQLFAVNGSWNGRSILSQEWINLSKAPLVDLNYYYFSDGYSIHMWNYSFETNQNIYECLFWAGWGEQYLFVIPELQLVFAVIGGNYYDLIEFSMHTIVEKYILNAVQN
ncbi:MAG: serine hydrolase [Melioribacteraceae bacterium]|nr:serine hydrolase [Melioribacteraceae bacterium]